MDRASLGATMRRIRELTAAPVATGAFRPSCDVDLSGREVFAACGIGNPRAFLATLASMGARVTGSRFFRDHHAFTAEDAAALARAPALVAVTEKDAVKLEPLWPAGVPLAVVRIEFEPREGAGAIAAAFDRMARR